MTGPHAPIALVARLTDLFEEQGIRYCHWKSNAAIDRSEAGENDLDLLVDRSQATAFREVLSRAGFVRVERQQKPFPPAKEDYFGRDDKTGKLVHVDAHFQLVLGHDRTKNYRVPLEEAFLESATRPGLLRVPAPELEYIVLLIRMVLKYAIWDEVAWQALRGRRAGPKPSERDELAHLEQEISRDKLAEIVQTSVPWLTTRLIADCARVAENEASLRARLSIGRQLRRRLVAHAQHGELADGALRVGRRVSGTLHRRMGIEHGFRLAHGGAIVAIIGGDGSGKSTAVEEVSRWLSHELDVRQIHLGKPDWSVVTYAVRGAFKLVSMARRSSDEPPYRAMAWLACTGRDRYLTYRKARRFADRGGVVISDRYPHPSLESMDVPLIDRLDRPESGTRVGRMLQRVERRYHDAIEMPEVVVVLKVDPETAAQRKTDEPFDYVLRRSAEVWEIDWESAGVSIVDGTRPKEEVASQLKAMIWEALA